MEKRNIIGLGIRNIIGFELIQQKIDGFMYRSKSRGLVVIQSMGQELDGKIWMHTSYSRKSRTPTYQDTVFIKENFISGDVKAIMIFPKKSEHVNIHPYCLHLWSCENNDGLPDFTQGTGSI